MPGLLLRRASHAHLRAVVVRLFRRIWSGHHSWVFMTNHIHLLARPTGLDSIGLMMQALGRRYVRYFNNRHRRTGTLWEGRYRSCLVDSDEYLLQCQRYLELNPVRAAMVTAPGDYRWSSYRTNAFGKHSKLVSPHALYQQLGRTPAERQSNYRALLGDTSQRSGQSYTHHNCQRLSAGKRQIQTQNRGTYRTISQRGETG